MYKRQVYAWLADRDSTDQDNINLNNTGRVPADRKKPVIMLDAHTDECGFMVQGIMDNGLLNMIMPVSYTHLKLCSGSVVYIDRSQN